MTWKPHVTVAALVERQGRFLCVEETISNTQRINQPAGHLEPGENLAEAIQREVLEETRFDFLPTEIVGIYLWRQTSDSPTFLRVTFSGELGQEHTDRTLDPDIDAVTWLNQDEMKARQAQWRSPLVGQCVEDFLAGRRYPMDIMIDMLDQADWQ